MIEINLRECPFCGGNTAHYVGEAGSMNVKCQWCDAEHNSAADWNTRPLEDALLKRAEAAEKRVAELEEAQRWISVSERLPEEMQDVLVSVGVKLSIMYHSRVGWRTDGWFIDNDVTHWMPLPQPPKPEVER